MRKTKIIAAIAGIAMFVTGCASPPSKIPPVAVASSEYNQFSCKELRHELTRVSSDLQEAERRQRSAVAGDAVTVFLVLVPVSAMAGDSESEVARLKGEKIAIEKIYFTPKLLI